jgi:hypothetical protein
MPEIWIYLKIKFLITIQIPACAVMTLELIQLEINLRNPSDGLSVRWTGHSDVFFRLKRRYCIHIF